MQTLVQEKKELSLREYIQAQSAPPVQQERMERLFSLSAKLRQKSPCFLNGGCVSCDSVWEIAEYLDRVLNGKYEDH